MAFIDEAGFSSTIATNSEFEMERYPRLGELLTSTQTLESIDAEEQYGTRAGPFRDLAHNLPRRGRKRGWPATVPPVEVQSAGLVVASRIAPTMVAYTAFFWDGLREHKLLFQRCKDCNTVSNT